MAIDTKAKRWGMLNWRAGNRPLFEPDGAIDADDRAHLLELYGGNAFDGPVAIVAATLDTVAGPSGDLTVTGTPGGLDVIGPPGDYTATRVL